MTHLMEENEKYREAGGSLDYLILLPPQPSDRIICVFHALFLFYIFRYIFNFEYLHMDLHTSTMCVPSACGARK